MPALSFPYYEMFTNFCQDYYYRTVKIIVRFLRERLGRLLRVWVGLTGPGCQVHATLPIIQPVKVNQIFLLLLLIGNVFAEG